MDAPQSWNKTISRTGKKKVWMCSSENYPEITNSDGFKRYVFI